MSRHALDLALIAVPLTLIAAAVAMPPAAATDPAVVRGNTAFAFDLYAKLREKSGNRFFSPFSVSTALAMTSAGAKGQTLDEMVKTLHLPPGTDAAHAGFGALLQQLQADPDKRGFELSVANALWGQQGLPFRKEFLDLTQKQYGAGLNTVDFGNPEQARQTINRWVEQHTKDRIKDLFAPGSLQGSTGLVLTNAIYFKGRWKQKFEERLTAPQPFHLGGGRDVQAPLMHKDGRFAYFGNNTLQAVELPYGGGDVSMVVLLPKSADGLAALEQSLDAATVDGWLGRLRPMPGDVYLPRFTMTDEFDLTQTLQTMGMKAAFTGQADFSGMLTTEPLSIGKVVHKAFVEANEEGTTAAAATGVAMARAAAPLHEDRFTFRADHPFMFLIRDAKSGSVLFVGRVANPVG
jgi:serpin B